MTQPVKKLVKLVNQNEKVLGAQFKKPINRIIKSNNELKVTKPRTPRTKANKKAKQDKINNDALRYIDILDKIKKLKFDRKIQSVRELQPILIREDVYEDLRKNRYVNEAKGVIMQRPLNKFNGKYINLQLFFSNEKVMYVNNNFRTILKNAHQILWNDNKISNANIQIHYMAIFPDQEEIDGVDMNKFYVAYTKSLDFSRNIDIDRMDFQLEAKESNVLFYYLGYKISYTNNKQGFNLSQRKIKQLKAYKPCSDRKYHELTESSTTSNKICIYESFIHIFGLKSLKYMHHNNANNNILINQMLKDEGEDIEKSVINGDLLESLIRLTKKYNTKIIVCFYSNNEDDKPFMVDNGVFSDIIDINLYIGQKAMLYYNEHVAPYIITAKNEDKKQKIEKYKMRPEYLVYDKTKNIDSEIDKRRQKNILGFDTETYRLDDGSCVVFNITIYGKLNNEIISKSFYGESCVDEFITYIDQICTKKYNQKSHSKKVIEDIYIYGFNNSNFDNLFIYDKLYSLDAGTKCVFTNTSIKKIEYNNITIFDLNLFYSGTLRHVAQSFDIEKEKGVYPYMYVNQNNINYIGECPDKSYWNDGDYEIYQKQNNNNIFNLKEYTEKYCMIDSQLCYEIALKHLYNCVGHINNRIYDTQNCQTSARIALKTFKYCFLNNDIVESPPKIQQNEVDRYKGGRTEIFKKEFDDNKKKLYYIDINSSYSACMTEQMPDNYIKSMTLNKKELTEKEIILTNGYYCKIEYMGTDNNFIPNILSRNHDGCVIATKNIDFQWVWGCEVLEAIKNNCKVICSEIEYYESHKESIFNNYIKYFYGERLKAKANNNSIKSSFYKIMLNSLYGKFGQKDKTSKKIVHNSHEMYAFLKDTDELISFQEINDKLLFEYKQTTNKYIGSLVRYSSYITASGRCKLSEVMRSIGHEHIYYCDTDSIFTDKLPPKKFLDNEKLGKWKIETKTPIKKAIFLSPKTYYYVCEDEQIAKKAKGIKADKLTETDYILMNNKSVSKIIQENNMFSRSLENGVKINPVVRTIHTMYNKRIFTGNDSEAFDNIKQWKSNSEYKKNYDMIIKELNYLF